MKLSLKLSSSLRRPGRHFLTCASLIAALGLVPFAESATDPWKNYVGATQYLTAWGEIMREGRADPLTNTSILATHSWMYGAASGLGSGRVQSSVNDFMNQVEVDGGAAWKSEVTTKAQALIAAHTGNVHQAYWQIGNEINSRHFGNGAQNVSNTDNMGTMRDWAVSKGYAYPHPLAPQDGADGTTDGRNDRGYIPYFVEYFMAPAIEALNEVNATVTPENRIKILSGSIANAATEGARTLWVPELMNYTIQGTYAPTLAGRKVKEMVEVLTVHYLMGGASSQTLLDEYYSNWVFAPGATITGVWATEEIGVQAADQGFGAINALQVFSRYLDVWLGGNLTSQQGALTFFGTNNAGDHAVNPIYPLQSVKPDYAMAKLSEFVPSATTSFRAFVEVPATDAGLPVETLAFETADGAKRVVFVSPMSTSAHTLGSLTMEGGSWAGNSVTATARLFTRTGDSVPAASVASNSDGSFQITLSPAINMGTEDKTLLIMCTVQDTTPPVISAPADMVVEASGPDGAVVSFTATAEDAISGPAVVTASPTSGTLFPAGTTMVTLTATDAAGNIATQTFFVTVQDTIAPVITALAASPNVLWSPNHKMVVVTLSATASDIVDPVPALQIVSVESNEATDGADWEITGPLTLNLRAEREGEGSGRVYTITIQATDAAGNSSTATTSVSVPHDQGS